MSQFQAAPTIPLKTGTDGKEYVDYKSVEDLRRMMTPNGKIYTRKRLDASARSSDEWPRPSSELATWHCFPTPAPRSEHRKAVSTL